MSGSFFSLISLWVDGLMGWWVGGLMS